VVNNRGMIGPRLELPDVEAVDLEPLEPLWLEGHLSRPLATRTTTHLTTVPINVMRVLGSPAWRKERSKRSWLIRAPVVGRTRRSDSSLRSVSLALTQRR
jgi:hypothetical protein